jgi:hypothetical protein
MNASLRTSPHASRAGRVTLLTAAPLAALAVAVYAFSGVQGEADVGHAAAAATIAPAGMPAIPQPGAASPEESPVPSEHDAQLLAYRPHGG